MKSHETDETMEEQSLTLGGALVGRQRDLLGARAAVNAALAGAGGLVVITGEAGIGKSALVDELSRGVAAKTLWGVCWDEPGAPAFWPWTAVLTACATATGIEPGAELAPLLGTADSSTGPGLQRRLSLFDSVTRYLGDAAAVRPLVVVIEDLHCADEASLDLLRFLATSLRGQPVALLGTFRYPDLQPRSPLAESLSEMLRAARTVTLYGLDVAAVAELIRSATGREPGGALAGRVYERTAGNPLFVIEVAKLLAAQGNLDAEHIPVPPSVRQVIAHRLSYLPAQTLDVLSHASVVGQAFDVALLASLVGDAAATVADRLEEACVAGLARQGATLGVYEFTHALVRDVLYAGVPAAARRSRHRRIAEAIESIHTVDIDNHLNELADHYALAVPDADASQALAYALRSGRHALGMLAYEEAARRFERAVDLAATGAGDEEARVDALLALGDARMRAGDWTAATAAYDDAAASARGRHRPDELARAALGRGAGLSGFEVRLYDQRQLDLLREALDGLGDSGGDLRGWVLARLSVAESYLQDPAVRLERSKQAVAEARTLGDAKLLGYALSSYCDAIAGPAHTEERLALAGEMVRLGIDAHDPESELLGRRFRVVALVESGELGAMAAEVEAFARTAERLRWPLVEWYPPLWRCILALVAGRLHEVDGVLGKVTEIGRRAGSVNASIVTDVLRMQLALERGRPDEAYELLRPFIEDPEGGPNAAAWRALPLVRMGRRAEAAAVIDRLAAAGFALVVDAAWLEVIACVAEACAEIGHTDGARQLLPIITPYVDRFATGAFGAICFGSMHRHAGMLAHCAGDLDDADTHFRQALSANRRAGATLLIAHTRRQHAAVLRERAADGDEPAAEVMLAEADETYRQLGLEHWVTGPRRPPAEPAVFLRDGETWAVGYQGLQVRVRDVKGMAVLAMLLGAPGREFSVIDLVVPEAAGRPVPSADTGEVIDAQARRAYQRRLGELETEIDDATLNGETGRADRARAEREAIVEQLSAAYGLAGRVRRGNDPIERARSTVTKQVHGAIARIRRAQPALAQHLTNSVHTGRYCGYTPEAPITWSL